MMYVCCLRLLFTLKRSSKPEVLGPVLWTRSAILAMSSFRNNSNNGNNAYVCLFSTLSWPRKKEREGIIRGRAGGVMVRPWKAGNITSEIGNWSVFVLLGWRFVFGIIIKRDGRDRIVRCHHDSGNNKAVFLLRLRGLKWVTIMD